MRLIEAFLNDPLGFLAPLSMSLSYSHACPAHAKEPTPSQNHRVPLSKLKQLSLTALSPFFSQPNASNWQDRRQQGIKIVCWQAQHIDPNSSAWHTIIRLNAPSSWKRLTLMDGVFINGYRTETYFRMPWPWKNYLETFRGFEKERQMGYIKIKGKMKQMSYVRQNVFLILHLIILHKPPVA